MSDLFCFRHKKSQDKCECRTVVGGEFQHSTKLVSRKQALEVWYACGAFAENIAYKPEAVRALVQDYITCADMLAAFLLVDVPAEEDVGRLVRLKGMLVEAGWDTKNNSKS